MQLLVRCGAPARTVAVDCDPLQDVASLMAMVGASGSSSGGAADLVLFHGGRALPEHAPLFSCGLTSGATLQAVYRLRAGGGDGGSTGAESRSCYLEMYKGKTPDKVNPAEGLLAKWTRCHLSGADLSPPCVIDELGTLYNKDALLEALLKKTLPPQLAYITGLKSVTELKLTPHQAAAQVREQVKAAVKGLHNPGNEAAFCCPVTGLEFNGRFKFMVHRPTGTAVSEKAIKEVPAVVSELLGAEPKAEDWIPVNPTGDQLEALKVKQAERMAAERARKAKKAEKKLAAAQASNATAAIAAIPAQPSNGADAAAAGAANGHTNRVSGVMAGQKRSSPEPMAAPVAPSAAAAAAAAAASDPAAKKVKIPESVKSNSVYASLFTSSVKNPQKETFLCRATSARGVNLS